MSDAHLLQMRGINKSFPGVKALTDVHLDVKRGEVHALLGENGAGKSTLMKILSGVYQKDSGKIIMKGQGVEIHDPQTAQRLGISIIYQEFNLFPHLSVARNIFIGREPKNKTKIFLNEGKINEDAEKLLASIHQNIDPARKVNTLSVAEQQMVEIVKALSYENEVLVMDEPSAALTDTETEELFQVIRKLKKKNVGIIYISHRLEELQHIAERVTVLRDGRYIDTVNYNDVTTADLIRMMVGREMTDIYPPRTAAPGKVVLEVQNLRRRGIIEDVSFSIRSGEVLGIAGLMGAGRTETARAVFGADPLDGGTVLLDGKPVGISSPHSAIAKGIGYLTEDRKKNGLAMQLDVTNNVILSSLDLFTGFLSLIKEGKARESSSHLVKQLNVKTPSLQQKVKFLSGGNQQKVILARWLCRNSRVLFFDEPTRGIDVGAKREIYDLINTLTEQGVAVVMISSELPEILGMSDRILVMHEGRVAGELSRDEATEERVMFLATGHKETEQS